MSTPAETAADKKAAAMALNKCSGFGCDKPAKLQCPTCVNLKAPPAFFCGQDCFKANWPLHAPGHQDFQKAAVFQPPRYKWTGPLRPAYVTPRMACPADMDVPDYALTGMPVAEDRSKQQRDIPIFNAEQIAGIRAACAIGRAALDLAAKLCVVGAIPDRIDKALYAFVVGQGAYPSPLNYRRFPKSVCISVNEVICHGIPDMRPLQDGDIVNVDVSVFYKGYHGDLNETYTVGTVDAASKALIKTTHDALQAAIALVKPGTPLRAFGDAISAVVKKAGFSVVKSYCGHGIGEHFHCAPNIPHYANNKAAGVCREGMVFTIEPMVNAGVYSDALWPDNWTAVTTDGKRSAQFEHTVVVTADGCKILTARTKDSRPLWWEEEEVAKPAAEAEAAAPEASASKPE